MLIFTKGRIVGVDASGVTLDGQYAEKGEDEFSVTLLMKFPPNISLIQGPVTGSQGGSSEITFNLPCGFHSRQFVRIETQHGPINVKLVKLRGLDD